MKIVSWNTNGLRATYKSGHWADILKLKPDVLCLQEIKAESEQLPDEVRSPAGYFSYFSACKTKKGYSGVAVYSKIKLEKIFNHLIKQNILLKNRKKGKSYRVNRNSDIAKALFRLDGAIIKSYHPFN